MTEQAKNYQLNICTNRFCLGDGSQKILEQLQRELSDIPNLEVRAFGCLARCTTTPAVELSTPDEKYTHEVFRHRVEIFTKVGIWRMFGGTPVKDVVTTVRNRLSSTI